MMRGTLLAAALLVSILAPLPVHAQEVTPEVVEAPPPPPPADSGKALGDLLGSMFKVDDTPVDPARLALARITAAKLVPEGVYGRTMKDTFDKMLTPLMTGMMRMPAADLAKMGGADDAAADAVLGDESAGEVLKKADPHSEERAAIMTRIMSEEFTALMSTVEPKVREAFARIYARRYTAVQLRQLNAFFATPTGTAFAADFIGSFTDPEMMQASMSMVPKLFEIMPRIQERMRKETAHLPPYPPTDATAEAAADAAAGAVAAAAGEASDTGQEPWYDVSNWSGKEARAYERASARLLEASEASTAAESAVIEATRKRYIAAGWKAGMTANPEAPNDGAIAD